jgi:hypothetical protein
MSLYVEALTITQAITAVLFIASELLGVSSCKFNSVGEVIVNGFRCTIQKEPDLEME